MAVTSFLFFIGLNENYLVLYRQRGLGMIKWRYTDDQIAFAQAETVVHPSRSRSSAKHSSASRATASQPNLSLGYRTDGCVVARIGGVRRVCFGAGFGRRSAPGDCHQINRIEILDSHLRRLRGQNSIGIHTDARPRCRANASEAQKAPMGTVLFYNDPIFVKRPT